MALELAGLEPYENVDDAGQPVLDEEESLITVFHKMQLIVGADADQGEGSLFITQGRVIWLSSTTGAAPHGYAVEFPAITMHAVATDPESFNRPCLYIQLDQGEEDEPAQHEEEEEEGQEAADAGQGTFLEPELRFIPADAATLDDLFKAFCEGAERNPDLDAGEDEEGLGEFFYNEDEVLAGATDAALGMAEVEELVGGDPGRFEDAEEEEEEEGDEYEEFEGQQQGAAPPQHQQNGKA